MYVAMNGNLQYNDTEAARSLTSLTYYTLIVANYATNQISSARNTLNNFNMEILL